MCNVEITIRGDCRRAGEVGRALSGTSLHADIHKLDDNKDVAETERPDIAVPDSDDEAASKLDTTNAMTETYSSYSSPFQQACPYTFSDFESETQSTLDEAQVDLDETLPLFSSPEPDEDKTDLDETPLLERPSRPQLSSGKLRFNKVKSDRVKPSIGLDKTRHLQLT